MVVQVERLLNPPVPVSFRDRMPEALCAVVALAAVATGVVGVLGASWPRRALESWINIHALFGLLLCGLVLARYRWCVGHAFASDARGLSRHLSRMVYLVLYLVVGVSQILAILNHFIYGGAPAFNLFDDHSRNGPDHQGWNPGDDFQLFFACGLLALIFVRFLAYGVWSRTAKAPYSTPGIRCTPLRWELRSRFRSRRA
jgi:cytochrome b561